MRKFSLRTLLILFILINLASLGYCKLHPQNGYQRETYPNGKLKFETKHKKNIILRKRTFFDNGKINTLTKYKNGKEIYKKTYYENGNLKYFWTEKSGIAKYYNLDGTLKAEVIKDRSKIKE